MDQRVDRFCRGEPWLDATGRRHGGLLTGDDMAAWRASTETPATYDYAGYTVCKCGPWSLGHGEAEPVGLHLAGGSADPSLVDGVQRWEELAQRVAVDPVGLDAARRSVGLE